MKLAWLVAYRNALTSVHLLHALMANNTEIIRDTVLEVVHSADALSIGMREKLVIANVPFIL